MKKYRKIQHLVAQLVSASALQKVAGSNPVEILRQGYNLLMESSFKLSMPTMISIVGGIMAVLAAYFTSQAAAAGAVADVNTKVEVVASRVDDQTERLNRIENKVDKLLIKSGINPSTASN